jgi:hypothetical protein
MRAWLARNWTSGVRAGIVALLLVGGCGGVDSGGTGAVSQGAVAGLGSIIVNGVRFDDSTAIIRDEDEAPLARSRLALGVMTRIEATPTVLVSGVKRATANIIHVTSDLIGPVADADPANNTLTILGQTVLVTPATVFDSSIAGPLPTLVGATVEVHGRLDAANARYTATRIEARDNPAAYKVRGLIAAVDRTRQTFTIGSLTIDYSHVPAADLINVAVGKLVRVKLQAAAQVGAWPAIGVASAMVTLPDRDRVEVEGRITSWVSSRLFSVEGIAVDASHARFDGSEARIVLGARVSVEGSASGGVLVARTVEVEDDEGVGNSTYELHGVISAINTATKTFVVLGVSVDYGGTVQYSGGTAGDLALNRSVEVHGTLSARGTAISANEISIGP